MTGCRYHVRPDLLALKTRYGKTRIWFISYYSKSKGVTISETPYYNFNFKMCVLVSLARIHRTLTRPYGRSKSKNFLADIVKRAFVALWLTTLADITTVK